MIYNETNTNNTNNNLIFARVAKFGSEYIPKNLLEIFFVYFYVKYKTIENLEKLLFFHSFNVITVGS